MVDPRPLLLIVLVALSTGACAADDDNSGGHCYYDKVPGIAHIDSIDANTKSQSCYGDTMVVTFHFVPTSGESIPEDDSWEYGVFARYHPPLACLEPSGITVGAEFPAVRLDETHGSCQPVLYEVDTGPLCEALCRCGNGRCDPSETADLCPEDCEPPGQSKNPR